MLWPLLGLILGLVAGPASAQLKQTFYVAIAEEDVRQHAIDVNTGNGGNTTAPNPSTTRSVVSISATANGTIVYYDHWEDGYEADLANPVQASTETFNLDAGDFTALENNIFANPRNPAEIRYDGRDKLGSTESIAVTRSGWRLQEGTLLAGAVELFPTIDWGSRFIFPAGEDVATNNMFQHTAAAVMAGDRGAVIGLDLDGDGFDDQTQSLMAGESAYLDGLQIGSLLTSSDPVQVILMTGDVGSNYESRWFAMVPSPNWGASYYTPVDSAASVETRVLLYNPGTSAITVTHETRQPTVTTTTVDDTTSAAFDENSAPCGTPIAVTFNVPGPGNVAAVRLGFNATHTFRGDIRLTLQSPAGTTVQIVNENGGDGDNNYDILLDDTSANALDDGNADTTTAPFYDRTAAPSNAFTPFDGQAAAGNWTLRYCDAFNGDSGTYNRSQLQVDIATGGSSVVSGTVSVPAGGITEFIMPEDSAAHFFTAGGESFFALSTIDYDGLTHDWGHPLLPEDALSTVLVVGWAPGRDPTSGTNPTENGSPVWVTATGPTTIYIDFDGDPTTGALTDPEGNMYDEDRTLAELETTQIFDTGDGDQSGMRIYTLDATLLSAAWGQDPDTASGGAPGLDLGTIVLPLEILRALKDGVLYDDVDGDGGIDPGDSLLYSILIENISNAVVTNVTVEDFGLDPNITYVVDTTEIDGLSIPDDVGPATAFPLDEGGYLLGSIGIGQTILATFVALVDDPLPGGVTEIANQVRVTTTSQIETGSSVTPVGNPRLAITKASDVVGDAQAGQTVTYTITVENLDPAPANGIRVLDQLPDDTTYVAESTSVDGFELTSSTSNFDNTTSQAFGNGANPCGSPLVRSFVVGPSLTVTDVALGFNATHNFRGDIRLTLESPAGTRVEILSEDGGDGDNNYDFLLTNSSSAFIDDGNADTTAAPFYDRDAQPSNPFSPFIGEDSSGTWDLEICDTFGADDGTFNRAQLQISAVAASAITKTNEAAAVNPLIDGDPGNLVLAPDGFGLLTGQTMTVTFEVTVDDPLSRDTTAIINTAAVSSLEQLEPLRATVIDPVSRGGTIGDRVWLDVDGDGIDDVGEPGIANVLVSLFDAGGDGVPGGGDDTLIATELTGADGRYLFDRLPPGTYFVDVDGATVPSGLALTAGSTDPTATRTITAEEVFLDLDVGYTTADPNTAIIGDFIWSDADADGIQDPGEPGIGGVTVQLLDASDTVIDTVVTADDGSYRFTGVAPGEYRARVAASNFGGGQALDGYTVTTGPQSEGMTTSAPVLVAAGDIELQVDFGFDGTTYSIADAVWLDLDPDGVFDADEPPLANVTVDLLDASGDIIATVRTAADGSFSFDGLAPGDYTLSVSDHGGSLSGLGGTTADARARQLAVTIVGSNVSAQTFGYNGPATLGDRVWSDADGDGVQDADEIGLAGVTVELLNRSGVVIDSAVTDAFGAYLFDSILPDSYTVRVDSGTLPVGFSQTGDPDASLDNQGTALLALGESNRTLDFGYRDATRPDISGNVFEDFDVDGVDDGVGEPGFGGVTLELRDTSGNVLARTTTDGNGDYSFPDLPAGDYVVAVTDDDDVLADTRLTSGFDALPVTVVATDITGIDFGYARETRLGSIGDLVWLDADGDGQRDGAENGLSGVTVELYDPGPDGVLGGGNDTLLATTVTDTDGRYSFEGLAAGTYVAQVDTSTLPGGGTDLVATTANPSATVLLSAGERYVDADFGFGSAPGVGLIGDFVWFDADSDGVQDPGEAGIGGVIVELTGPGCAPCTTTTAADGSYAFPGLTPGTYDVDIDPASVPAIYSSSPTNTDGPWEVILAAGDAVGSADFGLPAAGAVGTIGDTVWLDLDGDGNIDAGEPGLEGVTLALTDTGGNVLANTTTGPDGTYAFTGLQAGSYRVEVTDLDGVLVGLNLVSGTNPTATIALAGGATFSDADFGYAASNGSGSIGDTVWHDLNADGTRDSGEPGMQGITLDLWVDTNNNGVIEPGTDNLVRSTVTDSTGHYEFSGLPDGNYLVDVTDASGVTAGMNLTSGTPGVDGDSQSDPYDVTISGGLPNTTADFGYEAPADLQILGTAFFDLDGDGTQDLVDIGVEVVRVFLFRDMNGNGQIDPGDPLIATVPTDSDGNYIFTDLPPGNFVVAVDGTGTFVDGAIQTTQLITNTVQPVTLVVVDSTDNDFGFNRPATVAIITDVHLEMRDGRVGIAWSTASEAGTAGFRVWRETHEGLVPVAELVPSPNGAPQGADYWAEDATLGDSAASEGALGDSTASYLLEEIVREGRGWVYGPYAAELREGQELGRSKELDQGGPVSRAVWSSPRRASGNAAERLVQAKLTADLSLAMAQSRQAKAAIVSAEGPVTLAPTNTVKLLVDRDGLQFVPVSGLANAMGLTVEEAESTLASGSLVLERQGQAVDAWTGNDGSENGLFFVGRARYDNFARYEVYWLRPGTLTTPVNAFGGAVTAAPGGTFTDQQAVEEDVFAATFVARDPRLDYWHWQGLIAGHGEFGEAELDLGLPDVDASAGGELTVHLRGASANNVPLEHHAIVEIDGRLVGETHFDDLLDHSVTFPLLPGDLGPEGATVTVRAVLDNGVSSGFFYVDGFEVRYDRFLTADQGQLEGEWPVGESSLTIDGFGGADLEVLDISDADHPRRITDALIESQGAAVTGTTRVSFGPPAGIDRFLVARRAEAARPTIVPDLPSDLRSESNAATYLVITSAPLTQAAQGLANLRLATLGSAQVVQVEDVMDEFNFGRPDPAALADFLATAYSDWQVPPRYVALVGRGHTDYRDLLGFGLPAIPATLTSTPFGLYSADAGLGDVDGDGKPEMAIGRVPVASAVELEDYLDKVATYELGAAAYSRNVLLVADNSDPGGDFGRDVSTLQASLPVGLTVTRVELTGDPSIARQQLIDGLESGTGWTSWVGHGGVDRMADEGVLLAEDAENLDNADRPTLLSAFSCNIARYELPGFTSLAEELVVADGGAVAVWAPSGLTLHPDSQIAQRLLAGAAFTGEHTTLGDLLLAVGEGFAKAAVLPSDHEVYQLIGDPGLELRLPVLEGSSALFIDNFEDGDTRRWSFATDLGDTQAKATGQP